ncbi:DUF2203 domain-containing protein [Fictibacillus phosphorivorans]|uniref:DUF2203 domain-containing protein n=1 Tax=Fictibacillus phosphorivorans TaxID=1221500 RepID=UPI0020400FFD|nr:DUF2203 family protein [Fictibacillus phosphorivorans]MCM3719650.1 DUF2203 domain-containing protein [Fictibacillus phosphorivorans]MCM3777276.1 DUF2203 domain-containing protein [Fictibacillus phosphorivorans]
MKRYTLEEANQLLPVLSKQFDSLHNLQREFDLWYESYKQVEPHLNAEEKVEWEKRIQHMELEAEVFISNILSYGVWFEDAFSSTLHFPAILNGKKGIFKWHPEEPLITVYQSAEEKITPLHLVN